MRVQAFKDVHFSGLGKHISFGIHFKKTVSIHIGIFCDFWLKFIIITEAKTLVKVMRRSMFLAGMFE